jgi:hypothetical protein
MRLSLEELIEQGKQIKSTGMFTGCDDFWRWHQSCVAFLEYVKLSFREEVRSPFDAQKGVQWLQSTFCKNDKHDNPQ